MRPNPHIEAMAPYALAPLTPDLLSLAQNESLRPPSPKTLEAARGALDSAMLYPDPEWTDLREAIAGVHDLDPASILCGAGSMELIGALAAAYLGPGDRALTTQYGYAFFSTATRLAGAEIDFATESGLTVAVDTILARVRPETKIVFVANPGNPTGTCIARRDVVRLRAALPPSVLLVIDEAYGEFAPAPDETCFDLVGRGNTVVLRTFSKAYGLAGMRVGWGLFPPDVAAQMRKILNPNNISGAAQAAAGAAMRDQDYMRETVAMTAAIRDSLTMRLRGLGIGTTDSHANFVLTRFANPESAAQADAALRAGGVLARGMGGYGLPDSLRITIGDEDAMRRAADALEGSNR